MSEFDDDLIADALEGRVAGGDVGVDGALAAVVGRANATRRRRAAFAGMGTMTGLIAVGALALNARSPDVVRTPSDSAVPTEPIPTDPVDDSVVGTLPDSAVPSTSTGPISTDGTAPTSTAAPGPSTTRAGTGGGPVTTSGSTLPSGTAPAGTVPPSSAPGTTAPGTSAPATTAPTSTEPETTDPETTDPETTEPDEPGTPPFSSRSYDSAGGSIVVSWNGTRLSLGSAIPASGYTATVEEQRDDRIRVSFDGPDEWRIEVRADENGLVTSSISS